MYARNQLQNDDHSDEEALCSQTTLNTFQSEAAGRKDGIPSSDFSSS